MSEQPYRLGLIGCGRFGKNYISTINKMDDVEIRYLATTKSENAKLVNNPVKVVANYTDIFFDKTINGVIIATPPETHFDIIKDCTATLMPFMVEKPMCTSLANTIKVQEAVSKTKVPCLVDYTQLFNPAFVELCKLFKNRKLTSVESKTNSFGPFRKDISMLWDWAPHDISMILTLVKEYPKKIDAFYDKNDNYDNSGVITIDLEFKGLKTSISIDNTANKKYRSFVATAGFSTMTMFGGELYESRDDKITQIHVSKEMPLKKAVEEFLLCIETGSQEGVNLSVDVAKILEKCASIIDKKS